MSVFALHNEANPVKLLWKTALPCPPCYIHSLAILQKYVIFIRKVRRLHHPLYHAKSSP
jgi:torulene dioxygenase